LGFLKKLSLASRFLIIKSCLINANKMNKSGLYLKRNSLLITKISQKFAFEVCI